MFRLLLVDGRPVAEHASPRPARGRSRCRPSSCCRCRARCRSRRRGCRSPDRRRRRCATRSPSRSTRRCCGTISACRSQQSEFQTCAIRPSRSGHRHDVPLVRRRVADVAAGRRDHEAARDVQRRGELLVRRVARDRGRPEHLAVGDAQLADPPVRGGGVDRRAVGRRGRRRVRDLRRAGVRRVRRRREAPEHLARCPRRSPRCLPYVVVTTNIAAATGRSARSRPSRRAAPAGARAWRRSAAVIPVPGADVVARGVVAEAAPVGVGGARQRGGRHGRDEQRRRARAASLNARPGPASSTHGPGGVSSDSACR